MGAFKGEAPQSACVRLLPEIKSHDASILSLADRLSNPTGVIVLRVGTVLSMRLNKICIPVTRFHEL